MPNEATQVNFSGCCSANKGKCVGQQSVAQKSVFPHLMSGSLRDACKSHSDLTWTKCKDVWREEEFFSQHHPLSTEPQWPPPGLMDLPGHLSLSCSLLGPSQIPQSSENTNPHVRSSLTLYHDTARASMRTDLKPQTSLSIHGWSWTLASGRPYNVQVGSQIPTAHL